jgi:small subunit ribosomal protein S16
MGAKKRPMYRLVVANSEDRRDGWALDYLGNYNPMVEPNDINIDFEKVTMWMKRGANPTETFRSLLKRTGYYKQD